MRDLQGIIALDKIAVERAADGDRGFTVAELIEIENRRKQELALVKAASDDKRAWVLARIRKILAA